MISVTRLLCGRSGQSDSMRYGPHKRSPNRTLTEEKIAPAVLVWNCTGRCNLKCAHCYSESENVAQDGELSGDEARALIDDLAKLGTSVLLFSGGEPLMRGDLFELGAYAAERGLRPVISTNGTLIDKERARKIRDAGFGYVGISLDGLEKTNDEFRGVEGAFASALAGIRNCQEAGVRVGVRFTISRRNAAEIDGIFDLVRDEGVPRLCLYHLVYSGRGAALQAEDLSRDEKRRAIDLIFRRTAELSGANPDIEVLTVDSPADGAYLYLRQREHDADAAAETLRLLRLNGGNSSGERIGCVDNLGRVHPDQFWRNHTLGNVREKEFSAIWNDPYSELLRDLRHRRELITGRCASCKFLDICGGGLRARAEAATGDIWASEPACCLTDEEASTG